MVLRNPPPLKGPVAPVARLKGLSHVKLPLKRCRTTGPEGGVAATLANVTLRCATML